MTGQSDGCYMVILDMSFKYVQVTPRLSYLSSIVACVIFGVIVVNEVNKFYCYISVLLDL